MKRRDVSRLALGASLSPLLVKPVMAQTAGDQNEDPPASFQDLRITIKNSPRTYNQVNIARKYTPGRRRFSVYWS
jgi:hypothetical protein